MPDHTQDYAGRREPDVENGLRLVTLLFERLRELDHRVAELERRHGGRRRAG
jgi:hypothetical protein